MNNSTTVARTTSPATLQRHIARIVTPPTTGPGFGPGHVSIPILESRALRENDPFILLQDDRVDLPGEPRELGAAHPHAGIETFTLMLEGFAKDSHEGDMSPGDAQWMTAGRGVIHNEDVRASGHMRLLQLWIRLPAAERGVAPRVQLLERETLPTRREPGVIARLYSGQTGVETSPTKNYARVTIVDFELQAGAAVEQKLPAGYNGFVYVLDGTAMAGADRTPVTKERVGWLDRPQGEGTRESVLRLEGGPLGGRAVMYVGEPQNERLVHYGPFVAGSEGEIEALVRGYRAGGFQRLSELKAEKGGEG